MGTAKDMIAAARDDIGMSGRPNSITREYAKRHGDEFLRAAWCDMAVTHWARVSGNLAAAMPKGDRAYTVWHAQDFQRIGRWHSGTVANLNKAKPGDIVFFDWGTSNSIGAIDHVGVIEKALGDGRVQTIEANTGDAVKRKIRSASVIAGYGRPAYEDSDGGDPDDDGEKGSAPPWPGRHITQPPVMTGDDVRTWQAQMRRRGWSITVDGAYGPRSEAVCRSFQEDKNLEVDGIVGPITWRMTWEAPIS